MDEPPDKPRQKPGPKPNPEERIRYFKRRLTDEHYARVKQFIRELKHQGEMKKEGKDRELPIRK